MKRLNIYTLFTTVLAIGFAYSSAAQQTIQVDVNSNQLIASPITIEVNSKGLWLAHEGELGTVQLFNENGEELSVAIIKSKDGNWMTSGNAFFTAELNFDTAKSKQGKLVFKNRIISKEGGQKEQHFEVQVKFYQETVKKLYFAEKRKVSGTDNFSFQLIEINVQPDNTFYGIHIHAPYGTDGLRGRFSGIYSPEKQSFKGQSENLAEGDIFEQDVQFHIRNSALQLGYEAPDGTRATLPQLTENEYIQLQKEYKKQMLEARITPAGKNRLEKIIKSASLGLNADDIKNITFYEREIDLDGNYATREFLLYLISPMFCGTGGCNLFVCNENGDILSQTTVVKLPVYIETSRAFNPAEKKPQWKDLYVWSNGAYRKLVWRDNAFTANASMGEAMDKRNLENNPQRFVVIMDHMDN